LKATNISGTISVSIIRERMLLLFIQTSRREQWDKNATRKAVKAANKKEKEVTCNSH
jgi:hypothetical protein